MTDRPIIFSAPMVRALLEGQKTQTRRVLPDSHPRFPNYNQIRTDVLVFDPAAPTVWYWDGIHDRVGASYPLRYAVGDRLWVREAHYLTDDGESEYAVFAADQDDVDEHLASMQATMASHPSIDWSRHLRLRPSIHMPRWASRLTLIVTDVRVQRLREISEEDAVAEGVMSDTDGWTDYLMPSTQCCQSARASFCSLWNSIYGPEAWDANPWLTVITFRTIHANIDSAEAAA